MNNLAATFLCLVFVRVALVSQAQPESDLRPAVANGLYGYIDVTGSFVIPPKFAYAAEFSEGLARVKLKTNGGGDGQIGFVNRLGSLVIPAQYDFAGNFSEGLALADCGYINNSGMKVIDLKDDCPTQDAAFTEDGEFHDGIAILHYLSGYAYINKTGKHITDYFEYAERSHEGLARVTIDGKYGFIDVSGHVIINAIYKRAGYFSNGWAPAVLEGLDHVSAGFIDKTGKFVLLAPKDQSGKPMWEPVTTFAEGMALVQKRGPGPKLIYIDNSGQQVIPQTFAAAEPFSEGIAFVNGGRAINKKGDLVFQLPLHAIAEPFSSGLARVNKGSDWGYINKKGKIVWQSFGAD